MNIPDVFLSATELTGNVERAAQLSSIDKLAESTGLPIATKPQLAMADFYLYWRDSKLTLKDQSTNNPVDICIDFCAGKNKHRLQFGGGYGQPLARAINAKPNTQQTVCDATGGLGHDAFVFASLGCRVVIFERSSVVFALLSDGLNRALNDPHIGAIARQMEVHHLDSQQLAEHWPHRDQPNTVYLDPMYPHSAKSAAAKKGMQTLQRLLPTADLSANQSAERQKNEQSLLGAALTIASHRVVVKRPAKAPAFANSNPVGCIKSPNTRYDIYNPGH